MSFIGYSEEIPSFVKLIVNEFEEDYEGDSYLVYYDKIKSFICGNSSEEELLDFFDNSKFCIFELDCLMQSIDFLICKNIEYKQKLYEFIEEHIDENADDNRNISIKGLSILYDDFFSVYNENIFDYECFYISIFGMFLHLGGDSFMYFIKDIIDHNSLTYEDFYFLLNFMRELVEFKYIDEYITDFVLYSEEFLDVVDDSLEDLSVVMFLTFRLKKVLKELIKNPENKKWSENKKLVIATLKLFSRYCKEYNLLCLDKNNESDREFGENRDIIYILLKYLTEFNITISDCKIILEIYSLLIFDYKEYDSIDKVTKLVKYLVLPLMLNEEEEFIKRFNDCNDNINLLTYYYLADKNYVELIHTKNIFSDNFGDIFLYTLKLISSEGKERKNERIVEFIDKFQGDIANIFDCGDKDLFNYISWIVNEAIKDCDDVGIFHKSFELLSRFKFADDSLYKLSCNLVSKLSGKFKYKFEGKSFYEHRLKYRESGNFYNKYDREYFFAKSLLLDEVNDDAIREGTSFIESILNYFKDRNCDNREKYYEKLVNNQYFDVYKFKVLEEIKLKRIDKDILKSECDFLIYESPSYVCLEFGLLLSTLLDECFYNEVIEDTVLKLVCGDVFYEINEKFNNLYKEKLFGDHGSEVFIMRWIAREYRDINYKDEIIEFLSDVHEKVGTYGYIYDIVLYDDLKEDRMFNNINSNTVRIKSIISLLKFDSKDTIANDPYIYTVFESCFKSYITNFVSLTQFQILNELYELIEEKYYNLIDEIRCKDIEFNENITEKQNKTFKSEYQQILRKINKALKSSEADSYYEEIFLSQDIEMINAILINEKKYYNDVMELFHDVITGNFDDTTLAGIYNKSTKNSYVANVFLKLISNYPHIISSILENKESNEWYTRIANCAV